MCLHHSHLIDHLQLQPRTRTPHARMLIILQRRVTKFEEIASLPNLSSLTLSNVDIPPHALQAILRYCCVWFCTHVNHSMPSLASITLQYLFHLTLATGPPYLYHRTGGI